MPESTRDHSYAERLESLSRRGVRRFVDVQAPYRWNLARLDLARTLDVGCGLGRNLAALPAGSVGVDHNAACVAACRSAGLVAWTTQEWDAAAAQESGAFDTLLLAHVAEHMVRRDAVDVLRTYLPALRPGGRVVLITPQERGFRSDPTHVEFVDLEAVREIADELRLQVLRQYSFPFPRALGRLFTYNEFVSVLRLAGP